MLPDLAILDSLKHLMESIQEIDCESTLERVLRTIEVVGNTLFSETDLVILRSTRDGELHGDFEGHAISLSISDSLAETKDGIRVDFLNDKTTLAQNAWLLPLLSPKNQLFGAIAFTDVENEADFLSCPKVNSLRLLATLALSRGYLIEEQSSAAREMAYAWSVVKSLLPSHPGNWKDYKLNGLLIPAREVGGDFYDFFLVDEDRMGFIIADATGKGTGACLQVATCRAYFRALLLAEQSDLKSLAGTLNRLICSDLRDDKFVTACFGWLDSRRNVIRYVNAGHGSGFLLSDGDVTELEEADPPLGVLKSLTFAQREILMSSGDLLAIFTDGWTERLVSDNEEFGEARLAEFLLETKDMTAKIAMRHVFQKYETKCLPYPQTDDVTALFIKRGVS